MSKTKSKTNKKKSKTCKSFCKNVFVPERERVEYEFDKKNHNGKNIGYRHIQRTNKPLAKTIKKLFFILCDHIYCQKKCNNTKSTFLKSFKQKRKDKLIEQGAVSGCRDLIKEFPSDYKNI